MIDKSLLNGDREPGPTKYRVAALGDRAAALRTNYPESRLIPHAVAFTLKRQGLWLDPGTLVCPTSPEACVPTPYRDKTLFWVRGIISPHLSLLLLLTIR